MSAQRPRSITTANTARSSARACPRCCDRGALDQPGSVGTGFFGPSPLTEETEAAGLSRLVIPAPLRAEDGRSASVDLSRTDGPFSYTVTLFALARARSDPRRSLDRPGADESREPDDERRASELLGTLRQEPFA